MANGTGAVKITGGHSDWTPNTLYQLLTEQLAGVAQRDRDRAETLSNAIEALNRLTDAKFVTFRTLIDSEADKVALALAAADKAVTKALQAVDDRFKASNDAVNKALDASDERFRSVNEFREQQTDLMARFLTRVEAEARLTALADKLDMLVLARAEEARLTREDIINADTKLDDRLKRLETGASNMQGRMWALGAAIATVVVVVNIAIAILLRGGT